jgi:hypothetical protein
LGLFCGLLLRCSFRVLGFSFFGLDCFLWLALAVPLYTPSVLRGALRVLIKLFLLIKKKMSPLTRWGMTHSIPNRRKINCIIATNLWLLRNGAIDDQWLPYSSYTQHQSTTMMYLLLKLSIVRISVHSKNATLERFVFLQMLFQGKG